ncbi:MAG: hypothetical protein RMK98_07700 [Bacteroidia bacterium]|nr:hypothetical protein [Bacteroidia bacterium]
MPLGLHSKHSAYTLGDEADLWVAELMDVSTLYTHNMVVLGADEGFFIEGALLAEGMFSDEPTFF